MTIANDHVVEIDYTLTNKAGETLDSSSGGQPLAYLHGHKNIVAGLEKDLAGKTIGDSFKSVVDPTEGYGEVNDKLVTEVPKDELASIPDLKEGISIQAQSSEGTQVFKIIKIGEEKITLDGNHPLAGQTLYFDITVKSVRAATEEEISHGHAHGPGGHHHH